MNTARFVGEIRIFGGNFAPLGWAFCDGSLLPVAENLQLFDFIKFDFGGDGKDHFALPDLRGRAALCMGDAQGPNKLHYAIGEQGGVEQVTLIPSQLPRHTHNARCNYENGNSDSPANNVWARSAELQYQTDSQAANEKMNEGAIAPDGKGQSHDNMLPYCAVNYIIALNGSQPV